MSHSNKSFFCGKFSHCTNQKNEIEIHCYKCLVFKIKNHFRLCKNNVSVKLLVLIHIVTHYVKPKKTKK